MKIMIDSNVIVSAAYNASSVPAQALSLAGKNHRLVLCDYILMECRKVITNKFPHLIAGFEKILTTYDYEIAPAPTDGISMRDPKDIPILNAAINANVDIIISGDKDFLALEIERPKVLSPAQFLVY
ncbi:MAG: putative toxin-antitoxin system toxin component, PIN family [Defluviitaleaceae bacterium]|nr:putative toxin-antitoxin system toxin component, PIN family [Defluviitaleaceae bacterium]MCL2274477.1 putative toxin-antitoxin system toxin component, PIN family [Defluviitaleaceae bacterium]